MFCIKERIQDMFDLIIGNIQRSDSPPVIWVGDQDGSRSRFKLDVETDVHWDPRSDPWWEGPVIGEDDPGSICAGHFDRR